MNPEIKAKWVAALRSGEYRQGRDLLRREDGSFCCLGVLCDLHAKETGGEWDDCYYLGEEYSLPPEVNEWSGHPERDTKLPYGLATYNDGVKSLRPHTFTEIADIIEAQL